MNSYGTQSESALKVIGVNIINRVYFWISLVGFVFSIFGFRLTHEALFGFGYGFFSIIVASCIFMACVQCRQGGSGRGRREPFDHDDLA